MTAELIGHHEICAKRRAVGSSLSIPRMIILVVGFAVMMVLVIVMPVMMSVIMVFAMMVFAMMFWCRRRSGGGGLAA